MMRPIVRKAAPWVLAFLAYTAVYAGAFLLTARIDPAEAILFALLNSLPEALAAPLVLRLAERQAGPPRRPLGRRLAVLAAAGLLFAAWSLTALTLTTAAHVAWQTGVFRIGLNPGVAIWRVAMSLLVFGTLAGLGSARAYAREARRESERAARAETLRAEARLAMLRAQLNPHFVLNVLHSLVGLVRRDPPLAADAIERLGTVLRYGLRVEGAGIDRIALRDELGFVSDTLELERLRLQERLRVRFEVDESLADREVPPFVLQPLVENAVRHAIAPRASGGSVVIRVHEEGASVVLEVEDDGDGASAASETGARPGLGLALLRDRLEALYRGRASLEAGRRGAGFRATVRLPRTPSEEDDAA